MNPTSSDSAVAAAPATAFPRVPWKRSPLLLVAYMAAIVILTWPWLAHPSTRVFDHWDPPFHAWKLAYAAKTLLSGHILPPYGNTNLYYPHSGAFFYEALHWPQAVFAAPLLALGVPEVAVYHVTLVFFWALSGVLFWAWLRALGLRDPFAAAGGLFFTVIPYRMSYAVEFNMQLAFGLPLLLFAIVRFFQRPGFRYACLAAVAWWLQATSELYQAIFVLFALPFWVLPFFARDPAIFKSFRRFWLPLLAAAALCGALALPFLLPYAKTLDDGTLGRSLAEMRLHAIEPFSYAIPWGKLRFYGIPKACMGEMSVFPTISLAALALWGIFACLPSARRRHATVAFGILAALAAIAAVPLHFAHGAGNVFAEIVSWLLLAAVVASLPWLWRKDRSLPRAAAIGAGAAALFGLAMSFGPDLFDTGSDAIASNHLFGCLHAVVSGLAGFRVVSRFSVFPMIALCLAAAVGLQAAADRLARRPRALRATLAAAFFAVFIAECIPAAPPAMRPVRDISSSAAIAAFDAVPGPAVLAIVPMGDRALDSEHMLTIERNDRLGVWAWGGTYPRFTREIQTFLAPGRGSASRGLRRLRQLWPEAYILEDRRPFHDLPPADYVKFFGPLAEVVAEDPEFRLFRLVPDLEPATEAVRLVRIDFVSDLPRAVFTLSAPSPARVWLDFNGVPVASFDISPEPAAFAADIPSSLLVHHLPQRYRFHAESDAPFVLSDFRLEAMPDGTPRPAAPAAPWPDFPWLPTFSNLPADATPFDVRYPGGISLRGVEVRPALSPSIIPIRFYFHFPETEDAAPSLLLAPGFAKDGAVVYRDFARLRSGIDASAFPLADGRLVAVDVKMKIFPRFRSGEVYDLTFDLYGSPDRRLNGRTPDGKKVRHLFLPLTVTIP